MTLDLQGQLEAHPFLRGLSEAHLEALASCATELNVKAGAFLFNEGEAADASYLVMRGRVVLEIYVPGRGGVTVESVDDGGVVGWSWLLSPHLWHFDARTTRPTHLIILNGPRVRALCDQDNTLAAALLSRFMGVAHRRVENLRLQLLDVYGQRAPVARAHVTSSHPARMG